MPPLWLCFPARQRYVLVNLQPFLLIFPFPLAGQPSDVPAGQAHQLPRQPPGRQVQEATGQALQLPGAAHGGSGHRVPRGSVSNEKPMSVTSLDKNHTVLFLTLTLVHAKLGSPVTKYLLCGRQEAIQMPLPPCLLSDYVDTAQASFPPPHLELTPSPLPISPRPPPASFLRSTAARGVCWGGKRRSNKANWVAAAAAPSIERKGLLLPTIRS